MSGNPTNQALESDTMEAIPSSGSTYAHIAKMMTFDTLHRFIKRGDLLSVRRELNAGVDPNLLNRFGWSLLMLAAIEGDTSIGELLISRGADVDAINKVGETALSLAAHKGHLPFHSNFAG